jgi:phospholipid N-methyltransferase
MSKGKTISKIKVTSKRKVRFPKKVSKGQITSKEMKITGYIDKEGNLKDSAPVEAIAGIGLSKASYLRSQGIKTIGDFRGTLALEGVIVEKIPAEPIIPITSLQKRQLVKNAKKLRDHAKSLTKKIDEKRHPATASQNWTRRRSGIISSMKADADHLEEIQSIMYSIADRIETDQLPESLYEIDTKTEVETLNSYSEFPHVWITNSHYKDLKEHAKLKREMELVETIGKSERDKEGWILELSRSEINALDELVLSYGRRYQKDKEKLKQSDLDYDETNKRERALRDLKWSYEEPKRRLAPYKRLAKMGITNEKTFQKVKRDFEGVKEPIKPKTEEEIKQERINELNDKIRGYKIPGFFPTPKPVARKLHAYADIKRGMTVLEPSAGNGLLADAIREFNEDNNIHNVQIDVIERNYDLQEILRLKGYNIVSNDFLEFNRKKYDRIIMNPPFEKGQDIIHVRHAYDLLKPGGRLVAIMSGGIKWGISSDKVEFRTFVDLRNGMIRELPEGSFKSAFKPTGVSTVMVVLEK